jgi:hypothetical protein
MCGAARAAISDDEVQKITLTGDAERPNKVTTMATGEAEFRWDEHGGIAFTLRVKNLSSLPTAAHIHGPADKDGTAPPIATIPITDTVMTGTLGSGVIAASLLAHFQRDALKDLFDKGMAYVNVHTKNYPNGEIRGQFKH